MASRRCPRCNLVNPETAAVCDCGWSFTEGAMTVLEEDPDQEAELRAQRRSQANGQIGLGVLLLLVGIVITAATYGSASSSGGGTYIIAYGPMIVGVIQIFRGLAASNG